MSSLKSIFRALGIAVALIVVFVVLVELLGPLIDDMVEAERIKAAVQDFRRDMNALGRHHLHECTSVKSSGDWRLDEFDERYVHFTGEIRNDCSVPLGVQVQAVFRDASGNIVTTEEFWPASTRNIAPGSTYPFSEMALPGSAAARIKTMDLLIIGVEEWK